MFLNLIFVKTQALLSHLFLPTVFIILITIYLLTKISIVKSNTIRNIINFWVDNSSKDNFYERSNNYQKVNNFKEKYGNVYVGNQLNLSDDDIKFILKKYCVYYNNLSEILKSKFFDRVLLFMHQKSFVIHSDSPFKEMPVLISSTAVQLSFGLEDYLLPHYRYIQIHKEEYFSKNSLRILAGNVEENCITLAWNQYLQGHIISTDGSNVGLHEMAHALYFQEIWVDKDDVLFYENFKALMYEGEEILQQNKCLFNLYSNYAFTNTQEFWAVSVELFFEKPQDLLNHYPPVFFHLQKVLKQNPLNKTNPYDLI